MRHRRVRGLSGATALTVFAAAALSACGLGDKEALASSIIDSYDLTIAKSTALAELTQSIKVNLPDLGPDVDVPEAPEVPPFSTPLLLDFANRRAGVVLRATPDEAGEIVAVLDDLTLYQRKVLVPGQDIGGRPWYKLDYHDLSDEVEQLDSLDGLPEFVVNAVNPIHLLNLARGVLTGSIEDRGREVVAGADTTRYSVRFSRSSAVRDWDEADVDAINGVFASMRIRASDDVVPGDVWLGDDGTMRQLSVRFRERFPERASVDITLTVRIDEFGGPVHVDIPAPREITRVRGFGSIQSQVAPTIAEGEGL